MKILKVKTAAGKTLFLKGAIDIIEKNSVYRLAARTKTGGFFFSINGMPAAHWTNKQIEKLAKTVKNKPKGCNQ